MNKLEQGILDQWQEREPELVEKLKQWMVSPDARYINIPFVTTNAVINEAVWDVDDEKFIKINYPVYVHSDPNEPTDGDSNVVVRTIKL
jgi:hypothetical protein